MIKRLIKKLVFRERASSEDYIAYLRKKGVQIGEDCKFFAPRLTTVDIQYPWMISIGNHVKITSGVIILTHDYSWSVLKRVSVNGKEPGMILGASGKVSIGNNVFIGMNTIIMRNVEIGDNVIIGAGSVVSRNLESNGVYAGNPAKRIMTVDDFYYKRENAQLREAVELAINYKSRYGVDPPKEVFHEFFFLFENGIDLLELFDKKLELCGGYEEAVKALKNHKARFDSFDAFLKYCSDHKGDYLGEQQ